MNFPLRQKRFLGALSILALVASLTPRARADDLSDAMEAVLRYTAALHDVDFPYTLSDRTMVTPCGAISLAAFCTLDNTVYLNVSELGRVSANPLFPLYAVAHEAAHAVQWNRGIGGMNTGGMTIGIELHADCLAGDTLSWLFSEARGLSKQDYMRAAVLLSGAASEVGDFEAPNRSHGTPQQRAGAVLQGFYGENHEACSR